MPEFDVEKIKKALADSRAQEAAVAAEESAYKETLKAERTRLAAQASLATEKAVTDRVRSGTIGVVGLSAPAYLGYYSGRKGEQLGALSTAGQAFGGAVAGSATLPHFLSSGSSMKRMGIGAVVGAAAYTALGQVANKIGRIRHKKEADTMPGRIKSLGTTIAQKGALPAAVLAGAGTAHLWHTTNKIQHDLPLQVAAASKSQHPAKIR